LFMTTPRTRFRGVAFGVVAITAADVIIVGAEYEGCERAWGLIEGAAGGCGAHHTEAGSRAGRATEA
jgi:hypothetical protein